MKISDCIETDVLIIGCGIGGAVAALQLSELGVSVTVITRGAPPTDSNSHFAQGGIIYKGQEDPPELLSEEIEHAGAGLCNPRAVKILANEGPKLVESFLISKVGVQFDRTSSGELALVREGGHSIPRIIHVADMTGQAIMSALLASVRLNPNIQLLTGYTAIDLLTPSHHSRNRVTLYDRQSCVGAYLLEQTHPHVIRCLARATILGTGGLGQIFLRTTNPPGARGDGLAMAYRTGARVINAEFVQFHPTMFYHPHASSFLISETVRGAGARLVHADGAPFMQKYDEKWKDLAPRDVVARSIHQEMLSCDLPNVYLDLCSYIPAKEIPENFPQLYQNCLALNVDPTRELIPVVPAAHYSCGGVWVDDWGQTTIERLYAVGEVACTGLHGANRLASTSLLEGLVWGDRIARDLSQRLKNSPVPNPDDIPSWQESGTEWPDPALISQDMSLVKNMMWNYVGLVRTTPRLQRALHELRNLESEIEAFYRRSRLTDSLIGLRNAVRTAVIITMAAWENKASLGCHFRE